MIKNLSTAALILLSIALVTTSFITTPASAADARNFNAGKIIDDVTFTDTSSMSAADIQVFLESKMPNCDTYGTRKAGGGTSNLTNRQWIEQNLGISPPYRCLTDYRENPDTGENNYGKNSTPAGALSAAQLISRYATMYNINPQTLIVTLQKENGLITDNIPIPKNYNEAMGFGCPDNRPAGAPACDPSYGSFSTQLYQAARHFRGYMDRPAGWYVPYNTGWNTILWNPNGACGTSDVYIENKATAALYSYTPYRPNQAALNAQYGYGDGCSAYGNRNFYMYFNDWFGSTYAPAFRWQPISQEYYTDATKTVPATTDIPPNGTIHLVLKVKNTGSATWSNKDSEYPINLATLPADNNSVFCTAGWLSCNRPARLQEASVAPGQVGTFEFDVANSTNTSGQYREYFTLVSEGRSWFNNPAMNFYLTPQKAVYTWNIQSQTAYTDATMTTPKGLWGVRGGDTAYLVVKAKNTGNVTWTNSGLHPINFAVVADKTSRLCTNEWLSCNRPAKLQEASVAPGQVGTFAFPVTIPNTPGDYIEYYSLVSEGKAWFDSTGINYWVKIAP